MKQDLYDLGVVYKYVITALSIQCIRWIINYNIIIFVIIIYYITPEIVKDDHDDFRFTRHSV